MKKLGVVENLKKILSPDKFDELVKELRKELTGNCWIKPGEECNLNVGEYPSSHCYSCNILLKQIDKLDLFEFLDDEDLKKLKKELKKELGEQFEKLLDDYWDTLSEEVKKKTEIVLELIEDRRVLNAVGVKIVKGLLEEEKIDFLKILSD